MPQVSVVVPMFNRHDVIGRAIKSVLAQTVSDFEVLIVDDGSTDGTLDAVAAFGDPRLRVIRHEMNRGAAAARNTGVSAATGRYVAFIDSDDEWLPEKLAEQLTRLERAPVNVALCCTGYWIVRARSHETKVRIPRSEQSWQDTLVGGCNLSPGSTAVIRRAAFETCGLFDERLRRLEDWDWLLRYIVHHDLVVVDKPLARIHFSERLAAGKVDMATALMRAKHGATMRGRGYWRWARFSAALRIEQAAGSFYSGRYARAMLFLSYGLLLYPRKQLGFFAQLAWRCVRLARGAIAGPHHHRHLP